MVRFSSNLKRPKAIIQQKYPFLSKEAPVFNQKHQQREQRAYNVSHSHSHSLPANYAVGATIVEEIGLTSEQALKKLIGELDRILKQKSTFKTIDQKSGFTLRYFSLFVFASWSLFKLGNWRLSLFCGLILALEIGLIEFIEKKRSAGAVRSSIKEIREKLRKIDKSLLSGSIDLDTLYSLVTSKYISFIIN